MDLTRLTAGDTEAISAPPLAVKSFREWHFAWETDVEPVDAADLAGNFLIE